MDETTDQAAIVAAARILSQANHVVALTGAGISVASGVPDFRSAGGLWERFDPASYATIDAFVMNPDRVWHMFRAVDELLKQATPNTAHRALVELEKLKRLVGIVTQNIDGLHQRAGSKRVVEFHGNGKTLHCIGCGRVYPARRRKKALADKAPRCRCGNALKPSAILFGEALPAVAVFDAQELVANTDVLLVIGTSANVAPASELPFLAKAAGADVIEFNLESTALTDTVSDLFVHGAAEYTLPKLLRHLRLML